MTSDFIRNKQQQIHSYLTGVMVFFTTVLSVTGLQSCRDESVIFIPERVPASTPEFSDISGFYLLNEGNMGSNKSTLDYYDYTTGDYIRNIYAEANPDVPMELGDVGNDLLIHGSRLYAVINCSNKVEVMDAVSARRIGQVDIPNCRYMKAHGGFLYVTSYAGPVEIRPDYRQRGYVAKIDTATLQEVDRCLVGYQPDGIEIVGEQIYVANSGGYMVPNYEKTVSVIDIATFTETERIEVGVNLSRLLADREGKLWIASRGDYIDVEPRLYCYDTRKKRLVANLNVGVSSMCLKGDSIMAVSTDWDELTMTRTTGYALIDTQSMAKVADSFITDGSEKEIKVPFGIAVNSANGDFFITDARNYVTPGRLHCYSADGVLQWSVRTGDIPAVIAFTGSRRDTEQSSEREPASRGK
ncbi:MAG: YncE family protein [Muribaculaceae bacterium]|nr:YncE family protein [Muribaculaceae bacterium]